MSDLNFIFIWSGKKQAKHSLPAVLHQQGGSVCLCCSLKVWFEWPPTSWLTPWKLVYLLQMNCSISNLPWGNSCWNSRYHRCGVVSSCPTRVHQHRLRPHIWAAVSLVLRHISGCDSLPWGSLCVLWWGRDGTDCAWQLGWRGHTAPSCPQPLPSDWQCLSQEWLNFSVRYRRKSRVLFLKTVVFLSWTKRMCYTCSRAPSSVRWSGFAEHLKQCFTIGAGKEWILRIEQQHHLGRVQKQQGPTRSGPPHGSRAGPGSPALSHHPSQEQGTWGGPG